VVEIEKVSYFFPFLPSKVALSSKSWPTPQKQKRFYNENGKEVIICYRQKEVLFAAEY